jgi:hypothetical protein
VVIDALVVLAVGAASIVLSAIRFFKPKPPAVALLSRLALASFYLVLGMALIGAGIYMLITGKTIG